MGEPKAASKRKRTLLLLCCTRIASEKKSSCVWQIADINSRTALSLVFMRVEYLSGNMGNDNVESARKLPAQVPEGNNTVYPTRVLY